MPDITKGKKKDVLYIFEAEMQWERDEKFDQEVGIIQERESKSFKQNCAKKLEQFTWDGQGLPGPLARPGACKASRLHL